jgi:hypothetical protein
VKKELNTEGVISSSAQVSYTQLQNIPADIVSSSAQVKVLLPVGTVSSSAQINTGSFTGSFTGNIDASSLNVNVSADFDGSVFLNSITNTTSPNQVLVLDDSTGRVFTTASVGGGGGTVGPGTTNTLALFNTTNTVSSSNIFQSDGSIGIGTSSPGNLLHVQGHISASALSGSLTNGALRLITEVTMVVSGAITASGSPTVELNLDSANYFTISASGTGTVTWQISNPPSSGRLQTFVIEYAGGGQKTNNWFTGTRWPGGVAPTLTSTGTDLLGFSSDDAGSLWRGVLLQRDSK